MSQETSNPAKMEEAFNRLAALVNDLPAKDREEIRDQLAVYTHDLKNTIGLVTGANALITRKAQPLEGGQAILEMGDFITNAAIRMDELIKLMVENLNNEITDS